LLQSKVGDIFVLRNQFLVTNVHGCLADVVENVKSGFSGSSMERKSRMSGVLAIDE